MLPYDKHLYRSQTKPAVRLHPHHGLCFCFFQGRGYSEAFTQNLQQILDTLRNDDPPVVMTLSQDPVCACCPNCRQGICATQEKVLSYDERVLRLCGLREGDAMPFEGFLELIHSRILDPGRRTSVCGDCQWDALCSGKPLL